MVRKSLFIWLFMVFFLIFIKFKNYNFVFYNNKNDFVILTVIFIYFFLETGIHSTGNIFAIIYYVLIFKTVKEKKYIMISIVVCSKNSELTIKETLRLNKKTII